MLYFQFIKMLGKHIYQWYTIVYSSRMYQHLCDTQHTLLGKLEDRVIQVYVQIFICVDIYVLLTLKTVNRKPIC